MTVDALATASNGASPAPAPSSAGVHHLFSERIWARAPRLSSSEASGGAPRRHPNVTMSAVTDGEGWSVWVNRSGSVPEMSLGSLACAVGMEIAPNTALLLGPANILAGGEVLPLLELDGRESV